MDTSTSVKTASLRWHLAALRFEHSMLRHARALRGMKYDPGQPRVPAGNTDGGQWTRIGGGLPSIGGALDSEAGETTGEESLDAVGADGPLSVSIDYSAALTGISTVDNTTRELSQTLARTMASVDFIPDWTPQVYGTAVHVAFGTAVRFQGIPGIGPRDVEQSFIGGAESRDYGLPASIRTDVVLRDAAGEIIAIYDLKTGGAKLTPARVRELREKTGVAPSTPIIELHVLRGATLKGKKGRRETLGFVIAQLWADLHQGRWRPAKAR